MNLSPRLNAASIAGSLALATSLLAIVAVLCPIPVFQAVPLMEFYSALGFTLSGIALLARQIHHPRFQLTTILAASGLITLIAAVSLIETVVPAASPAPMPAGTAICFILMGLAPAGSILKNRQVRLVCQYLLDGVTVIAAVAVIGYLYGMPLFYNLNFAEPIDISSAILFFVISLVTSLLQPELGLTGLFTGKLIGNLMAKRLLILTLSLIVLFGAVRLLALRLHLFSIQVGMAILIIGFLGVGLALLWHMVNRLNSVDLLRQKAEQEVKGVNQNLEKSVKLRSAKLLTLLAKLKESEAKFRTAFQHSAIGMALISLKGNWLKANKSLCDMVGYKEQELLTMSFMDLTHQEDEQLHLPVMEKALAGQQAPFRLEKRYTCNNGAVVWVSINIATVLDNDGKALYFVGQFENITDRKAAEKKLKAAYQQIKAHIEVIQDMNWKQSHIIRKPLANLKGLAGLLREEPSNDATLNYIQAELEHLDRIIIQMAEGACDQGITRLMAKRRSFKPAV